MGFRFAIDDSPEPPEQPEDGVEVGWYRRSQEAKERMLVVLAIPAECWISERTGGFSLRVHESDADAARSQIASFERESIPPQREPELTKLTAWGVFGLILFPLVLSCFFFLQGRADGRMENCGISDAVAVCGGMEWWRSGTALFLHADLSHLTANLAFGALFLFFLSQRTGAGMAWLVAFMAGFAGNLINAALYYPQAHLSLGASTAVFGALGGLTGIECASALQSRNISGLRRLMLPFGGGLALLAYLGTSGEHTDVMAHLWGFCSGTVLGLPLGWNAKRIGSRVQAAAGIATLLASALCWTCAMLLG